MYTMLHHGAAPGSPPQRRYDLRGGRSASNQPTANHPPPTTNDQPTTNHQPRTNLLSARPQQRPRSAPRSIRLGSSMRLCIFVRVRRRPSTAPRTARRCHDRPLEARGQTPRCDEPTGAPCVTADALALYQKIKICRYAQLAKLDIPPDCIALLDTVCNLVPCPAERKMKFRNPTGSL